MPITIHDAPDVPKLDRACAGRFVVLWTARDDAAPPMWKVRMVSWVPGSPIDCRDSRPGLTDVHLLAASKIASVAGDASTALDLAGQADRTSTRSTPASSIRATSSSLSRRFRFKHRTGVGVEDVLAGATQNALAERLNDLASLDKTWTRHRQGCRSRSPRQ